ncbi:Transcriptional regulator [Hahella chejuensis KCTC 2396]|uniref:Transcriptional regulator n=1 Tax=Hahella chejuensis (strain KCTC 2396) TaxID=349521 RepID=Q2SJ86_HAHCH|nr:Lrp/AsnC family transcriptional regulator [Hahella chejuensis]ABC29288.1 Transcriptional regulator [Hahella chejuensis KCTC 2396]
MNALDSFDVALLKALQEDCQQTSQQLAEKIGLSPTAIQRRIKRLREQGIIHKEVAILNSQLLGNRMTVIIQVILEKGGPRIVDAFKRRIIKFPEVQQCYYVAGEFDFVLIVNVANITEYDLLTRKLFPDDMKISKFYTIIAIEAVKADLSLPL